MIELGLFFQPAVCLTPHPHTAIIVQIFKKELIRDGTEEGTA